jgi:hypothetical protein
VKTIRERQEERRQLKLEEIERSISQGSLVIRQMSPAERAKYPPREQSPRRRR